MPETTVEEFETTVTDVDETEPDRQPTESPDDGLAGWFTASALRIGLALGVSSRKRLIQRR